MTSISQTTLARRSNHAAIQLSDFLDHLAANISNQIELSPTFCIPFDDRTLLSAHHASPLEHDPSISLAPQLDVHKLNLSL